MAEAPAAALRRKPGASIRVAAEAVARGEAAALFSAGHTGATVMAAHGAFGMLPGVDRPALAATIPTPARSGGPARRRRERRVPAAAPAAVRGDGQRVRARGVRHRRAARRPAVDRRGGDQGQRADARGAPAAEGLVARRSSATSRRATSTAATADVIVCDGFTGNIALKISEGLVEVVEELLQRGAVEHDHHAGRLAADAPGAAAFPPARRLLRVRRRAAARRRRRRHRRPRPSSAKAVRNAVAMAYRFAANRFIERVEHDIAAAAVPHQ